MDKSQKYWFLLVYDDEAIERLVSRYFAVHVELKWKSGIIIYISHLCVVEYLLKLNQNHF